MLNLILNNQWCLRRKHQLNMITQSTSLVKHIKIPECKTQTNLILASVFPIICFNLNSTATHLTINRKLNIGCAGLNRDSLRQLVQLTAQLGEVERVHSDFRRVISVGDAEVLRVQRDQV